MTEQQHPAFPMARLAAAGRPVPLTCRAAGDVVFRRADGSAVTREAFLGAVYQLAARLPERRHALNLCADRAHFLVALGAALARGQTSLLTSDRSPRGLGQIAAAYPDAYAVGDGAEGPAGIEQIEVTMEGGEADEVPAFPSLREAAIVFTSGSTGAPVPHAKPWAALAACSEAAAERFGLGTAGSPTASIVGTVPPQHMYGFETTILLPLHARASSFAGSTFYPHDVARALAAVPGPRTLVTTPLQIRALLAAGLPMPGLAQVISATAPLPVELAREAEAAWGTEVREIFGATEVGSVASRRTVEGDRWAAYRGVAVRAAGEEGAALAVPFLPAEVPLADRVEVLDAGSFRLLGRQADVVKLAGKRASLAGLNAILCGIEGVKDGAFLAPDETTAGGGPTPRLMAFVVAPGRAPEEILAALRERVEAPFLPRRVHMVEALPRNEVGKIARSALVDLAGGR